MSDKKKSTKVEPLTTDDLGKKNLVESPLANTGASHVYRVDQGESLPAQPAPKGQK